MCSNPQKHDGKIFACRVCNDCIATRKNDWVARCMAEKATSGETLVIELTYRNVNGELPDAAKAFRYADVQECLKKLREEYWRVYGARREIRYIACGERGSKRGRVHWHMVIFAERPISTLGKWRDFEFSPIPRMRRNKMLHWSMWPHGHVYPKNSDKEAIQYALKYALKDQFNVVNSKGTSREAKAENHGASYFRMSKVPPVGMTWLERKCAEWRERLVVPPKLELAIPDYGGYWWPRGLMRETLLKNLHEINEERKKRHGKDCPQWSSLLATVVEGQKDWELLQYGAEPEQAEGLERIREEIKRKESDAAKVKRDHEIRNRCGRAVICRACYTGKSREEKQKFQRWWKRGYEKWKKNGDHGAKETFDEWYRKTGAINPHCGFKETYPDHAFRKRAYRKRKGQKDL